MRLAYHVDGLFLTLEYKTAAEAMRAFYRIVGAVDLIRVIDESGKMILSGCSRDVWRVDEPPPTLH